MKQWQRRAGARRICIVLQSDVTQEVRADLTSRNVKIDGSACIAGTTSIQQVPSGRLMSIKRLNGRPKIKPLGL